MTAATLTGRTAEAEALLHIAISLDWPGIETPIIALFDALETYRSIERGDLHWDTAYPHLLAEAGEVAGYDLALAMAAEEVEVAHVALDSAMSAHCRGGNKTTSTTGESA